MSVGRWPTIGGWVLRGLLTAVFLAGAVMKLAATDFEVQGFARFGYAPWFMYAIGVAQLVGAVLLWVKGFTGAAASFLAAIMVGAVASHLRAGDPLSEAAPAIVILCALLGLAYARRMEISGLLSRHAPSRA